MAKMRRVSRAEWSQRVARWERSGLSCEDFSRHEGVSPRRLKWWRWTLQKEQSASAASAGAPAFVELVAAAMPAPGPVEVLLRTGAVMRVPVGFDENTVARLVHLLQGGRP